MGPSAISSGFAIIALIALSASVLRQRDRPDTVFFVALAAAVATAGSWAWYSQWGVGLSTALLAGVIASLAAFVLSLFVSREAWRLAVLLAPYLLLLSVLTLLSDQSVGDKPFQSRVTAWLSLHILASVLAYGIITVAAIASIAIFLQEGALNSRRRTFLSARLPSIAVTEHLELAGLCTAEIILGIGIVFGIAAEFTATGEMLVINHKSLFSLIAFAVIGVLLWLHFRTGLRGRQSARLGLIAYLLILLGYPGVKFVSGVLIGN